MTAHLATTFCVTFLAACLITVFFLGVALELPRRHAPAPDEQRLRRVLDIAHDFYRRA